MSPSQALTVALLVGCSAQALAAEALGSTKMRVEVAEQGGNLTERLFVYEGGSWIPALESSSLLYVRTLDANVACAPQRAQPTSEGLVVLGVCPGVGRFEQHLTLEADPDILHVATRLRLDKGLVVHSVEDRYNFLPPRHDVTDDHGGPLDFVWSQNLKREPDDVIPTYGFKSPAVMLQQGSVFAALLPSLSDRHVEVLALDLDVTTGPHPWFAFGAIPAEPHDHSFFRRSPEATLSPTDGEVRYEYRIALSAQPPLQGYRRVTHLLWTQMGHASLLASSTAQQNALRPELRSFDSWRQDAWHSYADRVFRSFPCGARECGTLASNRNQNGDWSNTQPDAWFNAWFQTLRTAYGWYMYGRTVDDAAMMGKAESVLNLALTSPTKNGAFGTIYLAEEKRWLPGDGWAGYADSYPAFSMSWTAYWMLRWAEDLVPQRRAEILRFVKPYGDFLVRNQEANGVIPSWYLASTLAPRPELRDFNAETGASALFLVTLSQSTGDAAYLRAAERAMDFVQREVLPRQRWFDFETYLSCARKDFDFYDPWTAQFPQNNLAEIQAVQAMLALFQATHQQHYLETGKAMLDHLLLTQQVWSNPQFTPNLFGGFTTQNTDAEWSDARQAYVATLLADFYRATGNFEYLERAVGAERSTFAVAPWENWAHTGYRDEPGALTGFHWGTGSAMTSVEILSPVFGDAFIDLNAKGGVGIDECSLTGLTIDGNAISFRLDSPDQRRTFLLRVAGVNPGRTYTVRWNDGGQHTVQGSTLLREGLRIGPAS